MIAERTEAHEIREQAIERRVLTEVVLCFIGPRVDFAVPEAVASALNRMLAGGHR